MKFLYWGYQGNVMVMKMFFSRLPRTAPWASRSHQRYADRDKHLIVWEVDPSIGRLIYFASWISANSQGLENKIKTFFYSPVFQHTRPHSGEKREKKNHLPWQKGSFVSAPPMPRDLPPSRSRSCFVTGCEDKDTLATSWIGIAILSLLEQSQETNRENSHLSEKKEKLFCSEMNGLLFKEP